MKIGDEVYIHGYVDEIRKDIVIIRNEGGYFGTVKDEIKQKPETDLNKIRDEIESKMETIIGHYDSTTLIRDMASYKAERNKAREECIKIIDKYR